jgi:hypothetical protein
VLTRLLLAHLGRRHRALVPLVLLVVGARVLARVVPVDHLAHLLPLQLLRIEGALLRDVLLTHGGEVLGRAAAVVVQLPVLELHHVAHYLVEEAAVVRDDEHGAPTAKRPPS